MYRAIIKRWAQFKDQAEAAYYAHRHKLSTQNGCLMRGACLVIFLFLQFKLLEVLHASHLDIVKMKTTGHNYLWWPEINQKIEMRTARQLLLILITGHHLRLRGIRFSSTLQAQWTTSCFFYCSALFLEMARSVLYELHYYSAHSYSTNYLICKNKVIITARSC